VRRPAACLFDLDGLLLDTEPLHALAWSQAAARFGQRLSQEQLLRLRGRRRADCALQVLEWIQASGRCDVASEALLAIRQPIAEALMPRAQPMAGARDLLERCRSLGIPMGLVTSSSAASVALKSTPHPWLSLIQMRIHGDDPELAAGKPAPDGFLLAARRLRVPIEECWAFEDSPVGAQAALAAGCVVHVVMPEGIPSEAYPDGIHLLQSLREVVVPDGGKRRQARQSPGLQ
jgi:HAD superfamily hydrolase (TIGR01509 family)